MPRFHIGAAHSLAHPQIDAVAHVNHLVLFSETKRPRWSFADIIAPPKGAAMMSRAGGVAVIAANEATDKAIKLAVDMAPDPVVVLVTTKAPGKAVESLLKAREGHGLIVCGPGSLHKALAVNEPGLASVESVTICKAKRKRKPLPPTIDPKPTETEG